MLLFFVSLFANATFYCLHVFTLYFLYHYKPGKKELIIYIILSAVLTQTIVLFPGLTSNMRTALIQISNIVLFLTVIKTKLLPKILSFLINYALIFLSDTLVIAIFYILHISFDLTKKDLVIANAMSFVVTPPIYLMILIIAYIKRKDLFHKIINRIRENLIPIIILLELFLGGALALELGWASAKNKLPFYVYILAFCFVFMTIILCILFIKMAFKEKERNKELLEFQNTIIRLYDSTRIFKHNYKNLLTALKGYSDVSDYGKLSKLIDDAFTEQQDAFSVPSNENIANVKDTGLKYLLISKHTTAQKMNIDLNINAYEFDDNTVISKKDLNSVIGILLDNALEAANENSNDKIVIFLYVNNPDELNVNVKNTYGVKPDINRIFGKNHTTKSGHSGLGLYYIKKILSGYPDIYYDILLEDGYFVFRLKVIKDMTTKNADKNTDYELK